LVEEVGLTSSWDLFWVGHFVGLPSGVRAASFLDGDYYFTVVRILGCGWGLGLVVHLGAVVLGLSGNST